MKASLGSDLGVDLCSSSLKGRTVDLVVTGSVGATESVKFVRALRRLGAEVYVVMTNSACMFTTPIALEWASSHKVELEFCGRSTHLASHDFCVIAPATANFISKVVSGICDDVASALVQSYLGYKKQVMFLPAMHDSLYDSCFVNKNIEILSTHGQLLSGIEAEGKKKFSNPAILADQVSHYFNKKLREKNNTTTSAFISMGSTKAYIDEIRYISNYSSGALGSCISEELYRFGIDTTVLCGSSQIKPTNYTNLIVREDFDSFTKEFKKLSESFWDLGVLCASVLDFVPEHVEKRKIHSDEDWTSVNLVKTPKLLSDLKAKIKIGFKLETRSETGSRDISQVVETYLKKFNLDYLVLNYIQDVSSLDHKAYLYKKEDSLKPITIDSKRQLASTIASLMSESV